MFIKSSRVVNLGNNAYQCKIILNNLPGNLTCDRFYMELNRLCLHTGKIRAFWGEIIQFFKETKHKYKTLGFTQRDKGYSLLISYFIYIFYDLEALPQEVLKWFLFYFIKNYLLLRDFVFLLENVVQILFHEENNNFNILSMYIFTYKIYWLLISHGKGLRAFWRRPGIRTYRHT